MAMQTPTISYKRHRFPPDIITHSVWLYCRFNLSFREVEEMLLKRGIDVSYETIRRWVRKFGPSIARCLRRREPQSGDIWHLDEVVVTIRGTKFWLWRAVDQHGIVLDEILQRTRDKKAAKRLLRRVMKKVGRPPKRFITDKLRSYGAAKREIAPGLEHRSHKGLNNRRREQSSAISKTGKGDAGISFSGQFATVCVNSLSHSELLLCSLSPSLRPLNPLSPPRSI